MYIHMLHVSCYRFTGVRGVSRLRLQGKDLPAHWGRVPAGGPFVLVEVLLRLVLLLNYH